MSGFVRFLGFATGKPDMTEPEMAFLWRGTLDDPITPSALNLNTFPKIT